MNGSDPAPSREQLKQAAAERAVEFVESGMVVGLGTGSTAIFATRRIAALLDDGALERIVGIATSRATEEEARRLGVPLMADEMPEAIDLTIDGADEVDPDMDLVNGGGGALLREKIVAEASSRVVIVVDESKPSPRLGTTCAVPVEIIPFGWRSQQRFLESLGATTSLRGGDASPFHTDSGNIILDCTFGPIADARELAAKLCGRAGIVDLGLFLGIATDLIIAGSSGVRHVPRGEKI
jgi:ribose 5-phosphate isomerase A